MSNAMKVIVGLGVLMLIAAVSLQIAAGIATGHVEAAAVDIVVRLGLWILAGAATLALVRRRWTLGALAIVGFMVADLYTTYLVRIQETPMVLDIVELGVAIALATLAVKFFQDHFGGRPPRET